MGSKKEIKDKKPSIKKAVPKKPSQLTLLKKELKNAQTKIKSLENNLKEQVKLNEVNINAFQEKAKKFQEKAQQEINKYKDHQKLSFEKEVQEVKKYSSQKLIDNILNPIINLDLVVNAPAPSEEVKNYVTGFKMILVQLYESLSEFGVTKIMPKINDTYDPSLHYAVSTKKGNKDKILEIKKIGFKLHDRTLKPAVVIVGK